MEFIHFVILFAFSAGVMVGVLGLWCIQRSQQVSAQKLKDAHDAEEQSSISGMSTPCLERTRPNSGSLVREALLPDSVFITRTGQCYHLDPHCQNKNHVMTHMKLCLVCQKKVKNKKW